MMPRIHFQIRYEWLDMPLRSNALNNKIAQLVALPITTHRKSRIYPSFNPSLVETLTYQLL
jgi:hypothetical protein